MKLSFIAVVILCLAGCNPPSLHQRAVRDLEVQDLAQRDDVAGNNRALRDGEEAFAAGVPANANPFQGAPGYTFKSESWLAGWIRASQKSKQQSDQEAGE